jgi:hypothetical protein
MKTFEDLEFKEHKGVKGAVHAKIKFENGSWISVIGGGDGQLPLKGNGTTSFEIMSNVTEKTILGVEGWLTPSKVTERMRWLQLKTD